MFIVHNTEEHSKMYGRLIYNGILAKVAFISFENPAFIHSFKNDGDNYKYQYIADFEFIDYISAITNKKCPHQKQVLICIDDFPDEIKGLLRMNPDVVNAFKTVFEDLKLDHLVKEN